MRIDCTKNVYNSFIINNKQQIKSALIFFDIPTNLKIKIFFNVKTSMHNNIVKLLCQHNINFDANVLKILLSLFFRIKVNVVLYFLR